MSAPRFFLTEPLAQTASEVRLPLSESDAHHAYAVLRIRRGDEVEAVEPGADAAWRMRVTHAAADGLTALPLERLQRVHRPLVTLVQGVAKGDKMDAIVRQAVEIGAAEVVPVLTERSVVRLKPNKRAEKGERWRRVAKAAAEQSHRERVPPVHDPAPLPDAVALLAEYDGVVVLWEDERQMGLDVALASWTPDPGQRIALVIGPEGGFSAGEIAMLEVAGAQTASLGPGILRTETAAVIALALVIHHFGGLGRD